MSTIFELDEGGWNQMVADAQNGLAATEADARPDWFDNTLSATGQGIMRGGAKVGDLMATAGRVFSPPAATEEEELQRQQTIEAADKLQQELRQSATDFWTPDPATTGVVGRVLGGVGEMALPLMAGGGNPSLLIGSQTLDTGKRLVDQGVDARTAGIVGATEGLATYAGFKVPIVGKTLGQRVFTGMGGNLAVGMASTFAEQQILEGNGYEELAQQYDPLDPEGRAVDLLMGAAFGAITHHGAPRLKPSERDAVLAAANARHYQVDTAPGRPMDAAASAAHQKAMATALDQLERGEPVNVDPSVMQQNFEPRPARQAPDDDVIREAIGDIADPAVPRATGAELSPSEGRLLEQHIKEIEQLQTIDDSVKADLRGAYAKAATVKSAFDVGVRAIAREVGSPHEPAIPPLKGAARAAEKVMADYAGDVSKLKHLVRATIVVDDIAQSKAALKAAIAKFGEPTKMRNSLDEAMETPDGYRDINLNFKVNGQTVELQINLPEMLAAKYKAEKGYHERRTIEVQAKGKFTAEQVARMNELDNEMKSSYAAAWKDALSRSNSPLDISTPSSRGNLTETGRPSGTSQARTSAPPSLVGTMETGTPSQLKNLGRSSKSAINNSSSGIIPEAGPDSPNITAAKALLEQQDVLIPTGEVDAEGNAVTVSGRELAAKWDQDIAAAQREATKFEAAVSCFLTQGTE